MLNTVQPMVVAGPLDWRPLPGQQRRRWPYAVVTFVVVAFLALPVSGLFVTLPYYAIAPGTAYEVNDLITVASDRRFPPKGQVLLTTVALGRVTPLDAVQGWLDPSIDVVHEDVIIPPRTSDQQFQQQNIQAMDTSKQLAVVVALRRLGYDVPAKGQGALVEAVVPGGPADGQLRPGDVITGVAGAGTSFAENVVEAVRGRQPGDTVALDVRGPDGATRTVQIRLGTNPDTGVAMVGVQLATKGLAFDLPFDVRIDSGGIGGPSAGLAFTLGLIDELTAGELTGGTRIGVTGTIGIDGTVGEVGGVAQKTVAVRRSGAAAFLVPPGEYEEALRHADGLRIVKVATLDDAIRALGQLGGDIAAIGPPATAQR